MLYLTRKVGESIIINNSIVVTVVEVRGRTAKLGFSFPPEATILRKEIHDKITEQNRAALAESFGEEDVFGVVDLALPKDNNAKNGDSDG